MSQILLIDDDELLRETVQQMLEIDGHRVTVAADGELGLQLFSSGRYDVVITDILMPGIDGTQVIVELQKRRPGLPMIAISGGRRVLTPTFNLETAALAGATCQLSKPFTRQQLQAALVQAQA